jgi:hypothetical protein
MPPPAPLPPPPGLYPSWGGTATLNATRERGWDVKALRNVRIAAVLGLVAAVLSLIAVALPGLVSLLAVNQTSGGGTALSVNLPLQAGLYIGGAGALGIVGILLYRSAFRTLAQVSTEFSTPGTLALVALIGVLLALAGLGVLLLALTQAIACVGAGNPLTGACLLTGTFWAGLALILIGAILAVVGYIGILIGIWRLGRRFDNGLFKVGAVLLIFPYLNVVGEILILVGASQELGRK